MNSVLKISLVKDESVLKQTVRLVRDIDKVLSSEVWGPYLTSNFGHQDLSLMTHFSTTQRAERSAIKPLIGFRYQPEASANLNGSSIPYTSFAVLFSPHCGASLCFKLPLLPLSITVCSDSIKREIRLFAEPWQNAPPAPTFTEP